MSAEVRARPELGRLFRLALACGAEEAVRAHVSRGADVNARDARGLTPLMIAAAKGHLATCRYLIDAGADLTLVDHDGHDQLWHANLAGHSGIIQLLQSAFNPAPVPTVTPVTSLSPALNVTEPEGLSLAWEVEEEPTCPEVVSLPVDAARRLQRELATRRAANLDPEIGLIVELPTMRAARESSHDEALEAGITDMLRVGRQAGWIAPRRLQQLASEFPRYDKAHLRRLLEEAGVLLDDAWAVELLDQSHHDDDGSELDIDAAEILDYLESFRSSDPLVAYQRDLAGLSRLDRFEEESLVKSGARGMQMACVALAASPAALAMLLSDLEDVGCGLRPLGTFVTFDEDWSQSGEVDDEPEDTAIENFLPQSLRSSVDALRSALIHGDDPDGVARSGRVASRLVRDLGLTSAYISELCLRLSCHEEWVPDANEIRLGLRQAETARRRLIEAHLGHVVVAAARFGRGMPLTDLIQEANIGLMRAAEKFDPDRGNRFWTYATWWVRQSLTRASADQSRLIRLPVHVTEVLARLRRLDREYRERSEDLPGPLQVAAELVISLPLATRLRQWRGEPLSAGLLISDASDPRRLLQVASDECPLGTALSDELRRDVEAALKELDERAADILRRRFGLSGMEEQTLEEVGAIYNVTRERIRQIESKALRKLARPGRDNILRHHLG